jgi:hypothetical protein
MLTRKHFIEFADLLVELDNFEKPYKDLLVEIIQTIDKNFPNEIQSQLYPMGALRFKVDRILNHDKPDLYNNLCKEIMLILDRNSIRFNKYQFRNYIKSHIEKKQLNNIKNENTTKLNKVGNMT